MKIEGKTALAMALFVVAVFKSTLSRILRDLEDRGLVFRYDYGMSKMVKLDSKKSV